MNPTGETIEAAGPTRYGMLRRLFVLGYTMNIVLWFVPAFRIEIGPWGGAEDFSILSMARLYSQTGLGWILFFVVTFASNVVFLVLAFSHPRRWTFITASSIVAPYILWRSFSARIQRSTNFSFRACWATSQAL